MSGAVYSTHWRVLALLGIADQPLPALPSRSRSRLLRESAMAMLKEFKDFFAEAERRSFGDRGGCRHRAKRSRQGVR